MQTIQEIIRKAEQEYQSGSTSISKYVDFDLAENINKIEAYKYSKHTSGETDTLGREKPSFNIVTAAINIWARATDLDRKHVRIKATKSQDMTESFLGTVKLQDWMRRENFGQFLNDWGRSLATYGSSIVKFVEKEDRLIPLVMAWPKMIVDSVDFESNPQIEILELTPAQLRRRVDTNGYDKDVVENLIATTESRKNNDGTNKDNKSEYIRLYEIHGEFSGAVYKQAIDEEPDENDEKDFFQQMHVVSYVQNEKKDGFDEFTLVSAKEKESPYMITHLMKEDGRVQGIGAVEHLFEAQWMVNHTIKAMKDQLDFASKMLFQTADGNFVGQNALMSLMTGDILIHEFNKPLTQLNNQSHDLTSLQAFGNQWRVLAQELTSTPDIMQGKNMPSGTAYRQAAIIQQESHSNFSVMTQNKALALEQMLRLYIIPFLKKQLDTTKEVAATLEAQDITRIDSRFIKNKAIRNVNKKIINTVLQGGDITPETAGMMMNQEMESIKSGLGEMGNQRFFAPSELSDKTWKDALKDLEWDVEVEIVDENTNKEVVMTTLSTILKDIISNPGLLNDPNARLVYNKLLEETGRVSPIELSALPMSNGGRA